MTIELFWNTLLDNAVFLIVMLPLVGVCVVNLVSGFGIEVIRRVVWCNVFLTAALSTLMVAHYDARRLSSANTPQLVQMMSSLRWVETTNSSSTATGNKVGESELVPQGSRPMGGLDIRFAVGVDGISLWFVALTAWLMIPATWLGRAVDRNRPVAFYSLLLVLQSALIGTFAALDVVFFIICAEGTWLLVSFLMGWTGRAQCLRGTHICWTTQLTAGLFLMLGLLSLVLARSWMSAGASATTPALTFSIPELIYGPARLSELASRRQFVPIWDQISPVIFLCLLAGYAIRLPMIPFHSWLTQAVADSPRFLTVLTVGVLVSVGCYGWLRFVLPIFPELCWFVRQPASYLAVAMIIYGSLVALTHADVVKLVLCISLSQIGLCLLGMFTFNSAGLSGAVLQLAGHGLSAGTALFLAALSESLPQDPHGKVTGSPSNRRLRWILIGVSFVLLTGMPGCAGFVGRMLVVFGVFQESASSALWALCGLAIGVWAVLSWYVRHELARPTLCPDSSLLLNRSGFAIVPVLIAINLSMGIVPQFFLSKMQPTIDAILKPYVATQQSDSESVQRHSKTPFSVHSRTAAGRSNR